MFLMAPLQLGYICRPAGVAGKPRVPNLGRTYAPSPELSGHMQLRPPLLHGTITPVHEKVDSRYVRGGIGRQEQIGTLELLGLAFAAAHMVLVSQKRDPSTWSWLLVSGRRNSPHGYLVSPSALGRRRDEVGNLGVDVARRD